MRLNYTRHMGLSGSNPCVMQALSPTPCVSATSMTDRRRTFDHAFAATWKFAAVCNAQHAHHGRHQIHSGSNEYLLSRRRWLLAPLIAATATVLRHSAPAFAASTILQYEESKLPKEYQELSSKLTHALTEAIEMDLSLAPEREVRRTADQAKGLVKDWILNWRDNRMVMSSTSHKQIKSSIQELGRFYTTNGQRARLSSETGKAILEKLNAASAALPM